MKKIFIVGDGMTDEPVPELNGKTPLEMANTENMDFLVKNGIIGLCKTIPEGFPPGSDIANMSLLGYDPTIYYTGRGPLEAEGIGIRVNEGECVFRCNLVYIQDGIMKDFTAGHISTMEAKGIIKDLNNKLSDESLRFYSGIDYRNILIIRGNFTNLKCTPPHDILNKSIYKFLPEGEGQNVIRELIFRSEDILKENSINIKRMKERKLPATHIWLWGQGFKPTLPSFKEKHKIDGSAITGVDLIRGIAKIVGLDVVNVRGATGFIDTNYEGKANAALDSLRKKNFVFIHVEAPDEASHMGDIALKLKAIEDLDRRLLGRILSNIRENFRLLLMPDHSTFIRTRTHSEDPVPFVLYGEGIKANNSKYYSERVAHNSHLYIKEGYKIISLLFHNNL